MSRCMLGGTLSAVRVDRLEDHVMHAEWLKVDEHLCRQVNETRKREGGSSQSEPHRFVRWSLPPPRENLYPL